MELKYEVGGEMDDITNSTMDVVLDQGEFSTISLLLLMSYSTF